MIQRLLLGCLASLSIVPSGQAGGLLPLAEHLDVVPEYLDGEWTWRLQTDTGDEDPTSVFLPATDLATPDGDRFSRPPGNQWDFLGMASGEPVWILPQSDNGATWPGWENGQSSIFGSYVETDPRVGSSPQKWIRISFVEVEGPGEFAMFQSDAFGPVVWMASSDGIGADDLYFLASGNHSHVNWSFSEKGVYRIRLAASAYLGPGQTNPTGADDPTDIFFAVGSCASWRAANFDMTEVMDEMVAGEDADPDKDGKVNLIEYAFGSDPNSASPINTETGETAGPEWLLVEDGGQTYPALRFFRRIHEDADVEYQVEWNDGLQGEWDTDAVEFDVEDFDDRWERVTVRDTGAVSGSRFGRVRILKGGS